MNDAIAAIRADLDASIERARARGADTADLVAVLANRMGKILADGGVPPSKVEVLVLAAAGQVRRSWQAHCPAPADVYRGGEALRRRSRRR